MPTIVAYQGHESAESSPAPTVDMWGSMGVGTMEDHAADTGIRAADRTIIATNPGMAAAASMSQAVEERPTIAAGQGMMVQAKSANQDPEQTEAAPKAPALSKPEASLRQVPTWVWLGATVALGLWFLKRR